MDNGKVFEGLTPQEQAIVALMREEPIPQISLEAMQRTCQIASHYLSRRSHPLDAGFWYAVFSAMNAVSALCWLIGAFALGMGARVLADSFTNFSPMSLLFALSPVPIITLAMQELSFRDGSLTQVERTCKYAPSCIYFARLWIGILLNAMVIAILGTLLISTDAGSMRIWLCSFVAMFLMGAVTFLVMLHIHHALPLSVMMTVWVVCSAFVISQDEVVALLEQLRFGVLIAAAIGSIVLFLGSTINVSKRLYA